jgi:hypothetical protein
MSLTFPQAGAFLTAALFSSLLFLLPPAQAGEGHDHGEAAPAATGPAMPRFTASSELFELVGVLKGQQLSLYLDHADSNAPVKGASLELELGGKTYKAQPHREDGEFELALPQALAPGVIAVTATISTASDSDLLAGELDIHDEHAHDEAAAAPARSWKAWTAGGIALLAAALLFAFGRNRRTGVSA